MIPHSAHARAREINAIIHTSLFIKFNDRAKYIMAFETTIVPKISPILKP